MNWYSYVNNNYVFLNLKSIIYYKQLLTKFNNLNLNFKKNVDVLYFYLCFNFLWIELKTHYLVHIKCIK